MKEGNQDETLPEWFRCSTLALGSRKMGGEEEPRGSCKRRKEKTFNYTAELYVKTIPCRHIGRFESIILLSPEILEF